VSGQITVTTTNRTSRTSDRQAPLKSGAFFVPVAHSGGATAFPYIPPALQA